MASYDDINGEWYRVCPKRSSNRALITVKFPFSTLFRLKSMTDITPFANRLGKNIKHLMKWAKRNGIEAWR
ncbi:class I SAM-dependent methyltransferase, partial [Neisseria gonorrhoeae]